MVPGLGLVKTLMTELQTSRDLQCQSTNGKRTLVFCGSVFKELNFIS